MNPLTNSIITKTKKEKQTKTKQQQQQNNNNEKTKAKHVHILWNVIDVGHWVFNEQRLQCISIHPLELSISKAQSFIVKQ